MSGADYQYELDRDRDFQEWLDSLAYPWTFTTYTERLVMNSPEKEGKSSHEPQFISNEPTKKGGNGTPM